MTQTWGLESLFHAQYDWTKGAGQLNGGRCPRRTSLVPLALPSFVLCLIGVEAEGLLDYQGRAGIMSIVRWNFRPVMFGVELLSQFFGSVALGHFDKICVLL